MKQKKLLASILLVVVLAIVIFSVFKNGNNKVELKESNTNLISVLVDGIEQSAFPVKGSAEYQSTSCTNGETAVWDATNWKLSVQDISASTRCVVSFVTGGHNAYVTVSGGTVDSAPKQVNHNGNVTFVVAAANANYVFTSVTCTSAASYSWANNVLSVNGVTADAYCSVVFSRPVYTVYFNVVGGYTAANYLTVVRGGSNSTTFGAVAGFLTSGAVINCDPGITGSIAGTRTSISNVLSSGDCIINCSQDTSNFLPGGATYNIGDEVSYANLAWLVVTSDDESVTLILKANATYSGTSGSNVTGTGIYGSGVTFTSSSARSYLQDIWLQQTAQSYLKSAIDLGGIIYQDTANGYIRVPYAAEVNTNLPNSSNTNFWTMDNDGSGHIYYGQPTGYLTEGKSVIDNKYYFEHYTLADNTTINYTKTLKNTTNNENFYWTVKSTPFLYYTHNQISCESLQVTQLIPTNNKEFVVTGNLTKSSSESRFEEGASYAGFAKWSKNAKVYEKAESDMPQTTALTYSSTTNGNSGTTTSIQAVSPTSSWARRNDSLPLETLESDAIPTTSTPDPTTDHFYSTGCTYFQLWSGSWCYLNGVNTARKDPNYYYMSNAAGCTNIYTNDQIHYLGTYEKYTLKEYNTSTMGYRPVIVVKKAN